MFSDISHRIRKRRTDVGMTIEELAEKANVSVSLISKIERGQVANVSLKKLQGIADALEMDIADFFEDDKQLDPDTITLINRMEKLSDEKRREASKLFLKILRF